MAADRKQFAVVIDGDNAQPQLVPQILEKVKEYGDPVIKRVYGDWSNDALKSWKSAANRYAFETRHRFNGSAGKNATDIALVIDAMDILWQHPNELDGFCIVSSDSDFTHLAHRIRQDDLMVIGIGRENTPPSFKESCDVFYATEQMQPQAQSPDDNEPIKPIIKPISAPQFRKLLIVAYEEALRNSMPDQDGWLPLISIKEMMAGLDRDFAARDYHNSRTLADKVKALAASEPERFEIAEDTAVRPVIHYVRVDDTLNKFRRAYHDTASELNGSSKWVLLTQIRQTLTKLYPAYDPLIYRGTKHSQFKKVVQSLATDYPDAVELHPTNPDMQIRVR